MTTPLNQKIAAMAEAAAASFGLQLVAARFGGQSGRSTLQVLLENPDGTSPDVEICAKISRLLSAQLDVADIIVGKYTLEVSSAGLDRPLLTVADYTRFVGKGAAVKFKTPQTFKGKPLGAAKGVLAAVAGPQITLQIDGTPLVFAFDDVQAAELAPTAEELAALMGFHAKPKRGTAHPLKGQGLKKPLTKERA